MQIEVFALVKNRLNTDKNSQLLYVKKQLAIKVAVYLTAENNKKMSKSQFYGPTCNILNDNDFCDC